LHIHIYMRWQLLHLHTLSISQVNLYVRSQLLHLHTLSISLSLSLA
jgi:hypothetical protein